MYKTSTDYDLYMYITIEKLIFLPDRPPRGPSGIGKGAIERLKSRPLTSSGGLFLAAFSSSNTSSIGG